MHKEEDVFWRYFCTLQWLWETTWGGSSPLLFPGTLPHNLMQVLLVSAIPVGHLSSEFSRPLWTPLSMSMFPRLQGAHGGLSKKSLIVMNFGDSAG